jgi:hypothetical protein
MDVSKLFNVLVVGGAVLTAGGCDEDAPVEVPDARAANAPGGDAGQDATPAQVDAAPTELMECGFCPNDCCVMDEHGMSVPKDGFVCCWGTSC